MRFISSTHTRRNHSECILNKKNISNLDAVYVEDLLKKHKERLFKKTKLKRISTNAENLEKFFDIAKKDNFQQSNVFGPSVVIDQNYPFYSRHKLSPRDQICSNCSAYYG